MFRSPARPLLKNTPAGTASAASSAATTAAACAAARRWPLPAGDTTEETHARRKMRCRLCLHRHRERNPARGPASDIPETVPVPPCATLVALCCGRACAQNSTCVRDQGEKYPCLRRGQLLLMIMACRTAFPTSPGPEPVGQRVGAFLRSHGALRSAPRAGGRCAPPAAGGLKTGSSGFCPRGG